MKLKRGAITILVSDERVTIEIEDREASTSFVEIAMTPENFCAALGRVAYTPCDILVNDLDKVGKKHENKIHTFELPADLDTFKKDIEAIHALAVLTCPKGWEPDKYYNSQGTFKHRQGKPTLVNVTIRRWK